MDITVRNTPHSQWQPLFLAMMPVIRRSASVAFRQLRGAARDEAIEEVLAHACVALARFVKQGRQGRAYPTVLARYAIAQTRVGRSIGTRLSSRDVLSIYAQRKQDFRVEPLVGCDAREIVWKDAAIEDRKTQVSDLAAFRIDFNEWLGLLSPRTRQVALALAIGHSTGEVARQFCVSPARISQMRRELRVSWLAFQRELPGQQLEQARSHIAA